MHVGKAKKCSLNHYQDILVIYTVNYNVLIYA